MISMNASLGFFKPKYKALHEILSAKLSPYAKDIIIFSLFLDSVHAKYKDKAIKKKRTFQTTGKTQFGGVIEGLTDSYHDPVFVNKLPMNATA